MVAVVDCGSCQPHVDTCATHVASDRVRATAVRRSRFTRDGIPALAIVGRVLRMICRLLPALCTCLGHDHAACPTFGRHGSITTSGCARCDCRTAGRSWLWSRRRRDREKPRPECTDLTWPVIAASREPPPSAAPAPAAYRPPA